MLQRRLSATCLTILAGATILFSLQHAKDIGAPIISALLLGVVLTPLSDLWDRLRVPPALSAFFSVLLAILTILAILLLAEPYVSKVVSQAPLIWEELRTTVDEFKRVLRGLEQISEDVVQAIEPANGVAATEGSVSIPSITDALFLAPQFAAQFLIFTGTLYFFLMSRNEIYDWASRSFHRFGENELRFAGQQVARYVLTITAINAGMGAVVALIMYFLGMPSPILWGLMAFGLNYILYLGPITLVVTLLVAGIVVFDGPISFLPAAIYLSINATESQFVTPTLVGRSLSVNPLTVFLSLVFWLWLWGPIGGIIAIPLLVWCMAAFKRIDDHTISSGTPGRL
ncbi:AI-2 transport protein TqsA [Ascidiaceihabitans donghaensis]|uniref:AI-2 transport protein TqsA n=1 Tax=Ascidiaceihabitans donghaensis TaxID=1510460 RepID=A0A2R8B917_9RHOB|nr:AI-2E family transporter [Ascidiaceihabitans donghaensis]SPH19570.1 AI-2 transport protein TqsA [Ascidiaceihabitans donghaensis]